MNSKLTHYFSNSLNVVGVFKDTDINYKFGLSLESQINDISYYGTNSIEELLEYLPKNETDVLILDYQLFLKEGIQVGTLRAIDRLRKNNYIHIILYCNQNFKSKNLEYIDEFSLICSDSQNGVDGLVETLSYQIWKRSNFENNYLFYKKDDLIFSQGDSVTELLILVEGEIGLIRSEDGENFQFEVCTGPKVLGLTPIEDSTQVREFSAKANSDVRLLKISCKDLAFSLKTLPYWLRLFLFENSSI